MSSNIRQERVAELLYEELSIMVSSELDDPRLSMVEVTQVVVSKDLRSAKVYVHHRADEISRSEVIKRLQRAIPYLRSQVAERCGLRVVPELVFHYDDTPATAARVDELLRQIAAERQEGANNT
ncbi:MAG: 30S ribosome-binding factor RbfA [Chloroflexi bacterium]|nr:MAG: 30S ribosome-binding factor RbfA [Chloroflexota bacterium]